MKCKFYIKYHLRSQFFVGAPKALTVKGFFGLFIVSLSGYS